MAEALLGVAQVAEDLRLIGPQAQRELETGGRLRWLSEFQEGVAQIILGLGVLRIDLQGPLVQWHGLVCTAQRSQCISRLDLAVRIEGRQRQRAAKTLQSRRPLPLIA